MTEAIRVDAHGGPEQLRHSAVEVPAPGPGEVHLRQSHIGVNYIDCYFRSGLYPSADLPFTPGLEGAGEILATGPGVSGLHVGQRVAYAGGPLGAYAAERIMPAERLVALPEAISNEKAAAMLLKGMTAYVLLHEVHAVQPGEWVLIHAAAGGVGLLLCQWARHRGARVIGTVGSPAKAELARAHGCEYSVLYRDEDIVERVRAITAGAGVGVAYDSVGAATLTRSLACLARRGMLVSFGQSSGTPPAIEVGQLAAGGSLYLTRPSVFDYIATPEALQSAASALFRMVEQDALQVRIGQRLALADAAAAHRALESRQSTGSTVLSA